MIIMMTDMLVTSFIRMEWPGHVSTQHVMMIMVIAIINIMIMIVMMMVMIFRVILFNWPPPKEYGKTWLGKFRCI